MKVATGTAVRAEGLVRHFGNFTVVDEVSMDIQEGEVFGLLGHNGAGKTTPRLLNGVLVPSTGDACVFGLSPSAGGTSVRSCTADPYGGESTDLVHGNLD